MVKSPMEYFEAQDFSTASSGQDISPAERVFLKKYLGVDDPAAMQGLPQVEGTPVLSLAGSQASASADASDSSAGIGSFPSVTPEAASAVAPDADAREDHNADISLSASPAEAEPVVPLDEMLRTAELVTMVGFYLSREAFVIPINVVLEVIHYEEPFKLPMAPSYMPGVVNLRGRILPVIELADLLLLPEEKSGAAVPQSNKLIIICEGKGLNVGLVIDKLHTMFKATQDNLNWNAEAHLGPSAELLSGLLETGEKLLGIISIEKLVDKILEV